MIAALREKWHKTRLIGRLSNRWMGKMNQRIEWLEAGLRQSADWRSEAGVAPHQTIVIGNDRLGVDAAWRLIEAGTAILWRGDWQNARRLLLTLTTRVDRLPCPDKRPAGAAASFAQQRRVQARRASLLGLLLVPLAADYSIPLRRAQDVKQACSEAYGAGMADSLVSLRELLAVISAHEWRKKGIPVPALEGRIYPHFGVFSPLRGDYVDLVAAAPLPADCTLAFDIGTGSGILAALLAHRGIPALVATDQDERALRCAGENLQKAALTANIRILKADLFPPGRASLVVCNPPWLPGQPSSPLEYAVYDPDSRMLRGFLAGLAAHLTAGGEGWLILSDLAEHLGLRTRTALLTMIKESGLVVVGRIDPRPTHPKAKNAGDPLHAARAAEITSLWRLAAA